MEFRTPVEIRPFEKKITHSMQGLSIGSCFAGNIAARMQRARFRIADNPFGVMFNPISIADALQAMYDGTRYEQGGLVCRDGVWSSFAFHGSFSSTCPGDALAAMNRAADEGGRALRGAEYVIVTFGTAWVYELAGGGGVVANCHKFPATDFRRRRLTVGEIVGRYNALLDSVLAGRQVIFTVSPVRHVKDGFPENTLSKAILIQAVHELVGSHPDAHYFPAFEIVNDELRDYRFYADDMVHPSQLAVDYIWERFSQAAFDAQTRQLAGEIAKLTDAMNHRPLNPDSQAHREFMRAMAVRARRLSEKYPEIDLTPEISYFSAGGFGLPDF